MIVFVNLVGRSFLNRVLKHSRLCFSSELSTTKWQMPQGYDTGIQLYNTIIRDKVPLILKNKGIATWYTCGPTVYSDAHIGHASCYVKFDVIRRIMEDIFKIHVVLLMGITDIDDKIINRAREEKRSTTEIARKYEKSFFVDLELLNVERPSMVARVTESIPQIIHFCERLIKKEHAYVTTEGNVYFIVPRNNSPTEPEPEFMPIIDPLKRDPRDFALWKTSKEDEPSWMSPWGRGRPGWHIECSAMASQIFGNTLDIHSGGSDLIFPHHMNEKSQSEAYHGIDQWVNYWIHAGILHVDDDIKMSKSLGNIISIQDFLRNSSANIFRMLCLQSTYRNSVQFTSATVELASNLYNKFHVFLNELELYLNMEIPCQPFDDRELCELFLQTQEMVIKVLRDDFNTSEALKLLVTLVSNTYQCLQPATETQRHSGFANLSAISNYMDRMFQIFGINITTKRKMNIELESFIDDVVGLRSAVRSCILKANLSENFENDTQDLLYMIDIQKRNLTSKCNTLNYDTVKLSSAVENFYINVQDIITETLTQWPSSVERKAVKSSKLKIPFFTTCDLFRQELFDLGIQIKDIKDYSVWHPREDAFKDFNKSMS